MRAHHRPLESNARDQYSTRALENFGLLRATMTTPRPDRKVAAVVRQPPHHLPSHPSVHSRVWVHKFEPARDHPIPLKICERVLRHDGLQHNLTIPRAPRQSTRAATKSSRITVRSAAVGGGFGNDLGRCRGPRERSDQYVSATPGRPVSNLISPSVPHRSHCPL